MKFLEKAFDNQNQFWKYLVVIIGALVAGQFIGGIPLVVVIVSNVMSAGGEISTNLTNLSQFGISKNVSLILMMLPFVVTFIFALIFIKGLHKRTFFETINGTKKIRITRCLSGFFAWGVLIVAYLIGDYLVSPENFTFQFEFSTFIPLLLISLFFIPIQTTTEELLFRGYLTQGIAGWTKNRWAALIIPAVLFGLMHSMNPEVETYGFWIAMPQYILFGLFFGLISILDDGIELAIGAHTANNLFASLFVTHEASALQTDAVFEQLSVNPNKETIALIIMCIITLVYFVKKYNWKFGILNKKIVPIEEPTDENNSLTID